MLPDIPIESFAFRHIGPRPAEIEEMLRSLGLSSLDELIDATVPTQIRPAEAISMPSVGSARPEHEVLAEMREMASKNRIFKSYIGMGYYDTITPPVIQRNVLEDPRWYTPYTPYQSEVSQGRLEALLNFQTMVMDLTGMEISNASLLDEATAAAEAMHVCYAVKGAEGKAFFIAMDCHPQTIAVVQTRAEALDIPVVIGDPAAFISGRPLFGALVQYPATDGAIYDLSPFIEKVHAANALAVVAADILSLALLKTPGEFGADIVVGSTQRFGVPMGFGGPHAAYMATREEYKRQIPGRIVGVSKDAEGRPAVRLALQTREQHIRRDKATSNICTAQVLLAVMASMYAVYHGSDGIEHIAQQVHEMARLLDAGLRRLGLQTGEAPFFDTVRVNLTHEESRNVMARAVERQINLRELNEGTICVSVDETTTKADVTALVEVFAGGQVAFGVGELDSGAVPQWPSSFLRTTPYLTHPVFNTHHSESEMLRYLNRLANKDLSLATSLVPLGSCTMKLNATTEMLPVSWPELNKLHPFAPADQTNGYRQLIEKLTAMLTDITGFPGISLQPNAGSQGEYAGLLVIRSYHQDRGESHRNVCLIPQSAHGTNPATATMAGMKIVVVKTDESGNIDVADLRSRAEANSANLAALMVTYPSTHGVFEEAITEICDIVHRNGGQVYMDGANMNAQVGICRPADFGPDVCHLNLHKTFCIPHGGGGPGMGPIGVKEHLIPYLPTHPVVPTGGPKAVGAVSAAPWGSPSILPISYAYIAMMGDKGLIMASQVAILNANYVARKLDPHFPVLYSGKRGLVAHECIVDVRPVKAKSGVEVEDVAKRLMDYSFHAPTVSFPVAGTMMIEPTESESKDELDRFCEAMIAIRREISAIESGNADRTDNVLKNAPHTAEHVVRDDWKHPYSRETAAYPAPWLRQWKYWPPVARVDNVYGERNMVCSCPPIEEYEI